MRRFGCLSRFFTHHVNGAELMQSSDLQTLLGRIVKADQVPLL